MAIPYKDLQGIFIPISETVRSKVKKRSTQLSRKNTSLETGNETQKIKVFWNLFPKYFIQVVIK